MSAEAAELFMSFLANIDNKIFIAPKMRMSMIAKDMDDNKFVDCAFAANADYLVSNDKVFKVLKTVEFPKINVLSIEEFIELINKN
ncbi:MAG: PIN domain-containing protein [Bacteroidia bacterium]